MRIVLAVVAFVLIVLFFASAALADKKVTDLVKFYEKEARVCKKNLAGIVVAKDKAEPYKSDAEIKPDFEVVLKAQTTITTQCVDLDAMVTFLKADPKAAFKQLQAEIDKRDAAIRAGRKATKQALTDSDPVIKRMIPKVNKRAATAGK